MSKDVPLSERIASGIAGGIKSVKSFVGSVKSNLESDDTGAQGESTRKVKFEGDIIKCPHCGAVITHSDAVCPMCNMKITGRNAVSSVQSFSDQLMEIEKKRKKRLALFDSVDKTVDPVDTKKLALIQSFPIPNTVDDILEFVLLAAANIDVPLSKKGLFRRSSVPGEPTRDNIAIVISDAWVQKLQQAYTKAELMFPSDPLFAKIQKIYSDKMKELRLLK